MVRLKALYHKYSLSATCISIPYGAIKSIYKCIIANRRARISIPYGAIKSHPPNCQFPETITFQFLMVRLKVKSLKNIKKLMKFQFLMVRLKGYFYHKWTSLNRISIPYGAIKRNVERRI